MFTQPDGYVVVEDLGSKNGTFVNGIRIGGRQALRPGDQIRMGHTTLVFEDAPASPASPPAAPAPGYAPPTQPLSPGGGNGKAVAALVLGILAILLSWIGVGLVLAIVAIVLGVAGKRAVDRGETGGNRGTAQAGLVLGVVGIPLSLLLSGLIGYGIFTALRATGDVQEVLLDYVEAVEAGDGEEACEQLTDELRQRVGQGDASNCAEAIESTFAGTQQLTDSDKDRLRDGDAKVDVEETDRASVENTGPGGDWRFEKVDGEWKLSDGPEL